MISIIILGALGAFRHAQGVSPKLMRTESAGEEELRAQADSAKVTTVLFETDATLRMGVSPKLMRTASVSEEELGAQGVSPKLMRTESAGEEELRAQADYANVTAALFETDATLRMVFDSLRPVGTQIQVQAKLDRPPPPAKTLSQMCVLTNEVTSASSKALLADAHYHDMIKDSLPFLKDKRLIIAGLWRQIGAEAVGSLWRALAALGCFFRDYQVIMIENDSTDSTKEGIRSVCEGDQRAWCFTLSGLGKQALHDGVRDRVKGLTALRQTLLMKVREFDPAALFDYVLMVDGDIFAEGNGGFDIAGAISAFGVTNPSGVAADVVCAFQLVGRTSAYYDTFAHRGPQCEYQDLTTTMHCPASSCGGGMAVYTMKALKETLCDYHYVNEQTCEHVPFNACLASKGHGKIVLYKPWGIAMAQQGVRSDWNCVSL